MPHRLIQPFLSYWEDSTLSNWTLAVIGVVCSAINAVYKIFFIEVNTLTTMTLNIINLQDLLSQVITGAVVALVSGACSVLGKVFVVALSRWLGRWKRSRKRKKLIRHA